MMKASKERRPGNIFTRVGMLPLLGGIATLVCVAALWVTGALGLLETKELPKDYVSPAVAAQQRPEGSAPVIAVGKTHIYVEGAPAGETEAILAAGKPVRITALFDKLVERRKLWDSVFPGEAFPGVYFVQDEATVAPVVLESIALTAKAAGYSGKLPLNPPRSD